MTLDEIKAKLVAIDPDIKHYFTMSDADAYSYWEETSRLPFTADGQHQGGWRFYVHRFTRIENDPTVIALFSALDADFRIAVRWTVGFEQESGYIHHIFECEAV